MKTKYLVFVAAVIFFIALASREAFACTSSVSFCPSSCTSQQKYCAIIGGSGCACMVNCLTEATCCSYGATGKCPTTGYDMDGKNCYIRCGASCTSSEVKVPNGRWDASEDGCGECNGKIQTKIDFGNGVSMNKNSCESGCGASTSCDEVYPGYRNETDKSIFCDSDCTEKKCGPSSCGQTVTHSVGYTLTCVYTSGDGWHWRDPYQEGYPPANFCCSDGDCPFGKKCDSPSGTPDATPGFTYTCYTPSAEQCAGTDRSPHIETNPCPSSATQNQNFQCTQTYTHDKGSDGGVHFSWLSSKAEYISISGCAGNIYTGFHDADSGSSCAKGATNCYQVVECQVKNGNKVTITIKPTSTGTLEVHHRAWDLSKDKDCGNNICDYDRDPSTGTCSSNCDKFSDDVIRCNHYTSIINVTTAQECPTSSSICSNPDGSVDCGDSTSGCLNSNDRKYYKVPDSAGQNVEVILTFSGTGCSANDLFIYSPCGSSPIYQSSGASSTKTWSGTPTHDITIGVIGDSTNNNCQWTLEVNCGTITTSTTTTTTTSTTTTSTTTTSTTSGSTTSTTTGPTTTTPPSGAQPLTFECKECEAKGKCECELTTTCEEGKWVLENKFSKPLLNSIVQNIPPVKINFTPNSTGEVSVTAICFKPEPARVNKTTVVVKEEFLKCPEECKILEDCSCKVEGCEDGRFQAFLGNMVLKNEKIGKASYTATFIPEKVGTAEVFVICNTPDKQAEARIPVTNGVSTTTIPGQKFTGSNSACGFTATGYKCSMDYSNNYGQSLYVVLFFVKSTGEVIEKSATITAGTGTGKTPDINFDCTGHSGNFDVSWKAFSDSSLSNPVAWSKSTERVKITC